VSKDNDNHHAPPRQIVFDEELQELILLSVLCEGDVQGSQNSVLSRQSDLADGAVAPLQASVMHSRMHV